MVKRVARNDEKTPQKLLWPNLCQIIQFVEVIFKNTTPYKTAQSKKLTIDRPTICEVIFQNL